jgi:hypothetical protein
MKPAKRTKNLVARVGWRLAPMPPFVVTGTGRCGTTFVATTLSELGVECGHEKVFSKYGVRKRFGGAGDASYLAVPHLPTYRGTVIHLVRHPIRVLSSLVGTEFFARDDEWLRPVLPYVSPTGDVVADAMRYVVTWNELIEPHADRRVRIEDFASTLPEVFDTLDRTLPNDADERLAQVSPTLNTRDRAEEIQSLADLPALPTRDALEALGRRYGYDMG